jgi:ankyrin repeat protein
MGTPGFKRMLVSVAFAALLPFVSHASFIHEAVEENDLAEVERLIEEEPLYVHSKDYHRRTPLFIAAAQGNIEIVKFLVEHGANVHPHVVTNGKLKKHESPINFAVDKGHKEIVEYLKEKGATYTIQAAVALNDC